MNNFVFHNPTKIIFGKDILTRLAEEIKPYAASVLLVSGKVGVKKSGLLDLVTGLLTKAGITYRELTGVDPNPRIDSVREGIRLCREHALGLVLAVGEGSVLDTAKAIAIGARTGAIPGTSSRARRSLMRRSPSAPCSPCPRPARR